MRVGFRGDWTQRITELATHPNGGPGSPHYLERVTGKLGLIPSGGPPDPPSIQKWSRVSGASDPDRGPVSTPFWDPDEDPGDIMDRDRIWPVDEVPEESETLEWEQEDRPPLTMPEADPDSRLVTLTADSIAFYYPWHSGGESYWGIYFRTSRMEEYIDAVQDFVGTDDLGPLLAEQIYEHELEHFYQERAATTLEDIAETPLYHDSAKTRASTWIEPWDHTQGGIPIRLVAEAMATAREVACANNQEKRPECPAGLAACIKRIRRNGPPGYNRFDEALGKERMTIARLAFLDLLSSPMQRQYELEKETADFVFGWRSLSGQHIPVSFVDA